LNPSTASTRSAVARLIRLTGQVQGVGLRPFVYRLATALQLHGEVWNDRQGAVIRLQGRGERLDAFLQRLRDDAPPLMRIDRIVATEASIEPALQGFTIAPSRDPDHEADAPDVAVDTAVCEDCLAELRGRTDRRRRYGLINCTNCGPRYSIVRDTPYDRPLTTMEPFPLCPDCAAEYADPGDRRFHAQPTACPACGPRLDLIDAAGLSYCTDPPDPCTAAAEALRAGRILAIKGLGGYHLAARADDPDAVERLRTRKRRPHKPFALMCAGADAAGRLVVLDDAALAAITSPARPIILAPRRQGEAALRASVAPNVAPNVHRLGVMLPATPIQHLIFDALAPELDTLVMTSGNLTEEPIAIDDDDARRRLAEIADLFLVHERGIVRAVDDSIRIASPGLGVRSLRRARGEAPEPTPLPVAPPEPGLCLGGDLAGAVALVHGDRAILSQHLGDLDHPLALEHARATVDDLARLHRVTPRWIACDLHPAYLSTTEAKRRAAELGLPLLAIQHHHAHAAAVMAEHGLDCTVIAITCDGVGYGDDGASWGGEVLVADLTESRRVASLAPLSLPGGDAASRDVRRTAAAVLHGLEGDAWAESAAAEAILPDPLSRSMLAAMLRTGARCTSSSAAGRCFDAAAALLGLCDTNHYRAQAPMALEAAAATVPETDRDACAGDWVIAPATEAQPARIVLDGLFRAMLDRGATVAARAARFHDALADALAAAAHQAAQGHGLNDVVLGGGVFANARFTARLERRLHEAGLTVHSPVRFPPGDGALALGQAAIAAARLARQPDSGAAPSMPFPLESEVR